MKKIKENGLLLYSIFIIIVTIIILGIFVILNVNVETEYTPESEVADEEISGSKP